MRLKGLLQILTCIAAVPAFAAEKQIWECRTSNPDARPILHLVEWESRSYVRFAHMRFSAMYQLEDDRQGWYFGNDGSGYYGYGLIVDADGKAWLHDFNQTDEEGLSTPLDYFLCEKTT